MAVRAASALPLAGEEEEQLQQVESEKEREGWRNRRKSSLESLRKSVQRVMTLNTIAKTMNHVRPCLRHPRISPFPSVRGVYQLAGACPRACRRSPGFTEGGLCRKCRK
jgi:hypothetical protein